MKKKGDKATARARARASERESNSNLFYLVLLQECTEKFESRSPRARARKRKKEGRAFGFFFLDIKLLCSLTGDAGVSNPAHKKNAASTAASLVLRWLVSVLFGVAIGVR
jgi:hypothetical protein